MFAAYSAMAFSKHYQLKMNVCTSSDVADILVRDKYLLHSTGIIYDNYRSLQYHGLYEQVLFPSVAYKVCLGSTSHKEVGQKIPRAVKILNLLFLHSKMVFRNSKLMAK